MQNQEPVKMNGDEVRRAVLARRTRIIVISMPDAADRRRRFVDRAAGCGLPWEFFQAYSELHASLNYDETEALLSHGRLLRPGELGCYSSHYAAWAQLLSDDVDQYVILEDDVIVDWEYLRKIIESDLTALKIEYLRLYYKYPVRQMIIMNGFVDRSKSLVELADHAYGTQGYLITKTAAATLLEHCQVVCRPIDDELDRTWAHGVRNLCVFPFPLIEESGASTIGVSRFERPPLPSHLRLRRRIRRFVERMRLRKAKALLRLRHARAH